MTPLSRLAWRLRRYLLRWYEFGLYALLLAMMLAVTLPALSSDAADESVQCGNIQSSAVVITR